MLHRGNQLSNTDSNWHWIPFKIHSAVNTSRRKWNGLKQVSLNLNPVSDSLIGWTFSLWILQIQIQLVKYRLTLTCKDTDTDTQTYTETNTDPLLYMTRTREELSKRTARGKSSPLYSNNKTITDNRFCPQSITHDVYWWSSLLSKIWLELTYMLHMAQLIPLPLTVSCFSESRLALSFWYRLTRVIMDKIQRTIEWLWVCVCVCVLMQQFWS